MKQNLLFNQASALGKRLAMVLTMLLTIGIGTMWGATEAITATDGTYSGSGDNAIHTWILTSCTVVQAKGSGTAVNQSYPNRWYQNNIITFTPKSGYTITEIVLIGSSSNYHGQTITASTGSVNTNSSTNTSTWSGSVNSSSSLTLTLGKQFRFGSVTITYSATTATKYTVTLVPGSGSVTDTELEEPNAGEGVTLPTPTLDCGDWEFAGWKTTSAVTTETTTKPTLIAAGAYSPTSDITLYAVYKRTEPTSGGGGGDVTESVDFSTKSYSNGQEVSSYEGTNFSVTFDKGTNSNAPKYYNSGTAIRVYAGGYFIVSSEATITKIVLTFGSSDKTNTITTNIDTYSNGTWTGSATSVQFTIGGTKDHRRIQAIEVTTSGGGSSSSTYYHSTPECSTETLVSVLPKIMNFWQSIFGYLWGIFGIKQGTVTYWVVSWWYRYITDAQK